MLAERFESADPYARIAAAVLRAVFGSAYARDFSIALWDGTVISASEKERFRLRINRAGALRAAFHPPIDLNAGRAFAAGLIECEGDVESAIDELYGAVHRMRAAAKWKIASLLRRLPKAQVAPAREARLRGRLHSLARDRAAIQFHYDQPVEFYRSFLDREMVYSCAYFDDGIDTLDDAQIAKIDHVLRKIRLKPGERLLDIGCGWGALVVRAAQRFGALVTGVTLSERQAEEGRRRIAQAHLEGNAQIELRDYRELQERAYDKVVSIGMFEHVGRLRLPEYFKTAFRLLRAGGLFLNHGIADQQASRKRKRAEGFVERFVFPDGELVPVSDALLIAERVGFEVRDVENLREHYTRTLRAWVANLERNREAAVAAANDATYRVWRLYLAGSAQGFRSGRIGVFQALLAKPREDGSVDVPATRRDLYARVG